VTIFATTMSVPSATTDIYYLFLLEWQKHQNHTTNLFTVHHADIKQQKMPSVNLRDSSTEVFS